MYKYDTEKSMMNRITTGYSNHVLQIQLHENTSQVNVINLPQARIMHCPQLHVITISRK